MLNAVARLVYSRRTSEHTTPLLQELHWLRVPEQIQFRLCVPAYHTTVCMACTWRTSPTACGQHQILSLVDVSALLTPRHYKCRRLVGLLLATVPFRWLQRGHRTVCHQRLGPAIGCSSLLTFRRKTKPHLFSSVMRLTWRCPHDQQTSALSCTTVFIARQHTDARY